MWLSFPGDLDLEKAWAALNLHEAARLRDDGWMKSCTTWDGHITVVSFPRFRV